MFQCIQKFHSPVHVTFHGEIVATRFEKKKYETQCNDKEYTMNTGTIQSEIGASITQKSAIIIERFNVSYSCIIVYAQTIHCSKP